MPNALHTDDETSDGPFFYSCEHGQSNHPCYCHLAVDKDARPVADDWVETYTSDAAPWVTDDVKSG